MFILSYKVYVRLIVLSYSQSRCVSRFIIRATLWRYLGRLLGNCLVGLSESQTQSRCVSRFIIRATLWRYLGRLLGNCLVGLSESQTQSRSVSRFIIRATLWRYLGRLLGRLLGKPLLNPKRKADLCRVL